MITDAATSVLRSRRPDHLTKLHYMLMIKEERVSPYKRKSNNFKRAGRGGST